MTSLYPVQDVFVRGEISPRLHARASIDLYRAALSKCENFITLPHGGIRKRGGTYFAGEVKTSSKETRVIPFVFSADQAYAIEVGDLYVRIYAYGARVGTVELVSPWPEAAIWDIQYTQSGDVMWMVHPDYPPQELTRLSNTSWTLSEFTFEDGPYLAINTTGTTLTPAATGAVHPLMTSATTPSGTASASLAPTSAWQVFDRDKDTYWQSGPTDDLSYDFAGTDTKVCDAYWIRAIGFGDPVAPTAWEFQGFDGTNWITLDSRQGEDGWARGSVRFYAFTNETAYQSYRLKFNGAEATGDLYVSETGWHEKAENQTAFNLTASSTTGINNGTGFQTTDVGRSIRLLGSDNQWRWARIVSRTSTTVVTIRLYNHALPDLQPIANWRLGAYTPGEQVECVTLFEERLTYSKRFTINASKTGDFDNFAIGEADDDALEFLQAGGGQANDIVWLAEADGFLLAATSGGIRALSGSGIDEALTPTSFKNRRSRTQGAARILPVDAGSSFIYVARSRRALMELNQNSVGRFVSDDIGQISEHIPKKGIVEIAYQSDPDPIVWFPVDTGEFAGYTHQPAQEVRGMHRHIVGGVLTGSDNAVVESMCVTPGQNAADDVWLVVKRTIGGVTKRYIEVMQPAFEYGAIVDAFQVDCGLSRTGSATNSVTGLSHLNGETVDILADGVVYKGRTVSAGAVSLPGGATAAKWHVGLPYTAAADTLELDVGGRDGSRMGRKKRVSHVILNVFETDLTGLQIRSKKRGGWENVKIPTNAAPSSTVTLTTDNIPVPVDDSWDGQARIEIRHTNPTPCTIRAMTPVFDAEP